MGQAPGETQYTFRQNTKPVYQRARDNLTQLAAYRDGVLQAPTAGTYTLLAPEDTDTSPTIDAEAVVVTGDIATYPITAAELPDTLGLGPGYQERWVLTMPDTRTYTIRRPVVLGRFQLFAPLSEEDVVAGEYPDLVVSLGGATVLQGLMDGAWLYCIRYLERQGRWADTVVDASDVFDWHRHETLKRCFKAMLMRQSQSERWRELFIEHRDEATQARQGLRITEDRDRDGRADSHGKRAVARSVVPNVPVRRRWVPGVYSKFG